MTNQPALFEDPATETETRFKAALKAAEVATRNGEPMPEGCHEFSILQRHIRDNKWRVAGLVENPKTGMCDFYSIDIVRK